MVVAVYLRSLDPPSDGFNGRVVREVTRLESEPAYVPKFIAKVSSLFDAILREPDVLTFGRDAHYPVPQAICSVLFDQIERVRGIAERLGHLLTFFVADNSGKINVFEGNAFGNFLLGNFLFGIVGTPVELQSCHNHSGNPKENDVGTGYES